MFDIYVLIEGIQRGMTQKQDILNTHYRGITKEEAEDKVRYYRDFILKINDKSLLAEGHIYISEANLSKKTEYFINQAGTVKRIVTEDGGQICLDI